MKANSLRLLYGAKMGKRGFKNGKERLQKQHILLNINETFQYFADSYPDVELKRSRHNAENKKAENDCKTEGQKKGKYCE